MESYKSTAVHETFQPLSNDVLLAITKLCMLETITRGKSQLACQPRVAKHIVVK